MNSLKISLAHLSDAAASIRSYNSRLDENLSNVSHLMNDLATVWKSDGADVLTSRFKKFALKFIEESEIIESYAKFLEQTVSNYDGLESTIVANASNFD